MASASVLPFLAALKNQIVPPQFGGPDPTANPALGQQQAPDMPPPDMSVGQPQQPPPPPPDPVGDIAQGMVASQGQPQLAGETKGHKLMRILMAGAQGGAVGAGQKTFGEGFQQGNQLPFQQASRNLNLQQQQAQTNLTKSQTGQVTIMGPNGQPMMLPAFLAKGALGASIGAQGKTQAAQIGAGAHVQGAQIGANARVQAAQMGLGPLADVPDDLQQQFGLPAKLPLKMLNQAEGAANRPLTTVAGEHDTYVVNKSTGEKKGLGVGSPRIAATLARPVQVAETDAEGNPTGKVTYQSAGQAMKSGGMAPSSVPFQAQKGVVKSFTSGKAADNLNAFNTAQDHLRILGQTAAALQNGDFQALNSVSQRWKEMTGDDAPTNFDMVRDAVSGELLKTFGHVTEGGVGRVNGSIHRAEGPKQLAGAIKEALDLMESKKGALNNQFNEGVKGKPAFKGQHDKKDSLGIL